MQVKQDVQLDQEESPEKTYAIRGFVRNHGSKDFENPEDYEWGTLGLEFTPVSAAYKAKQAS